MFTNWLAPPPTTSLPPDTIIEVGPPPFTRYAAHSALVSAHSGYLRAALRSDNSTGSTTAETIPIYVPNVTAEQFTPLLAYMYTGFLDLNIENIFGVLLATHILHMPRALELCRAFLSATQQQQQQQSENYFSGLNAISAVAKPKLEVETSKVVRPIASKATGIGLNFIAPPASHILLPSTHTPFKSLSGVGLVGPTAAPNVDTKRDSFSPPGSAKLTELNESSIATTPEEQPKSSKEQQQPPTSMTTSHKRSSKSLKRASSSKSDSVVTTASKESTNNNDKGVIVDIASCDGPVRFRRVLNDSYGINTSNNNKSICAPEESSKGGNSRYMSTSFHQQMVRNINERKQAASLTSGGESYTSKDENSQDTNRPHSPQSATTTHTNTGSSSSHATPAGTGETYNCVYCKHTFKSQYCYQKHAKRHLIPLSLEVGAPDPDADSGELSEKQPTTSSSLSSSARHAKSSYHKREVKPLDMNVQYYPCKTCGSKFPSYYFVHKHRKMCHADEEVL